MMAFLRLPEKHVLAPGSGRRGRQAQHSILSSNTVCFNCRRRVRSWTCPCDAPDMHQIYSCDRVPPRNDLKAWKALEVRKRAPSPETVVAHQGVTQFAVDVEDELEDVDWEEWDDRYDAAVLRVAQEWADRSRLVAEVRTGGRLITSLKPRNNSDAL